MSDSSRQTPDWQYSSLGYDVHQWRHGDTDVLVLHKEPFRIQWIATQLVTFVFLIPRIVEHYDEILDDYRNLRGYADDHKRTWLPFGFQCGFAILPIYLGSGFDASLKESIRSTFKKRWCVYHAPSLFDSESGELTTLATKSFWGCIYRPFITETVAEVARVISEDRAQGCHTA